MCFREVFGIVLEDLRRGVWNKLERCVWRYLGGFGIALEGCLRFGKPAPKLLFQKPMIYESQGS